MGTNEANGVVKPSQLIGDREVKVNANSLEPLVSAQVVSHSLLAVFTNLLLLQNVPIAPSPSDWSAHPQVKTFYVFCVIV